MFANQTICEFRKKGVFEANMFDIKQFDYRACQPWWARIANNNNTKCTLHMSGIFKYKYKVMMFFTIPVKSLNEFSRLLIFLFNRVTLWRAEKSQVAGKFTDARQRSTCLQSF